MPVSRKMMADLLVTHDELNRMYAAECSVATHFFHISPAGVVFVKEALWFRAQGGFAQDWGMDWFPIVASTVGDARRAAAEWRGIILSDIYVDEGVEKPAWEEGT